MGENILYDWEAKNRNVSYIFETSASPIYNQKHSVIGAD